jgi:competence protein ComEA
MKKTLYAGMLSLVICCSFSAQCAVNPVVSTKSLGSDSHALVSAKQQAGEKIDLNTADVHALSHSVKGIGQKRAEAIVKYRQTHGAFKTVTDLASVPGLGGNFVKKNSAELERLFKVS